MKKVLVALVSVLLVLMLVTACACSYVSSTSFLSRSKVNSLVKMYGTPQAVVTLTYTKSDNGEEKEREVKITYDLLLSQTPIAVIRFIQLANEGVYNDTLIDTNNTNHMIMGRYAAINDEETGKDVYFNRESDVTFAGEFQSNDYKEPDGGYAQFDIFSLAMYHEKTDDDSSFNAANGTLILALAKETLNSNNYAVFATFKSLTYMLDGKLQGVENRKSVPSDILTDLRGFTGRADRTVYNDETKAKATTIKMISTKVILHVEIKGAEGKSSDWSKLPRIGK